MELIYLWVKEYKNIRKQGFNFSGRYRCEYDDVKNELRINENIDFERVVLDSVNVHAVVGENGSGKSSIFEHANNHYVNERKILIYSISDKLILLAFFGKNIICDFIQTNQKYKLENIGCNQQALDNIKNKTIFLTNNYGKNIHPESLTSICIRIDENEVLQFAINLLKNSEIKIPFNTPNDLYLGLHGVGRVLVDFRGNIDHYIRKYGIKNNFIDDVLFYEESQEYSIKLLKFYLTAVSININNRDLGNAYHWIVGECNLRHPGTIDELVTIYSEYVSTFSNGAEILSRIENFVGQIEKYFVFENSFTLRADIKNIPNDFIENYISITTNRQSPLRETYQILEFSFPNDFSSGEGQFLYLFAQIYHYMHEKKILFIDEVELYYHPNWQRKYNYYLIEFLSKNFPNQRFNVYLATHSPFVLSDIPSQNIVFLKNNAQISKKLNTFGANIHTLLSDAFFMEDGLMGEYAKSKINKAIELLNKQGKLNRSSMKYCEEIISIIGEPILKKQLQRMLDSKRLSKIDEIDMLKAQMSEIQQKIKKLEGGK